jgi:hypothetical protein
VLVFVAGAVLVGLVEVWARAMATERTTRIKTAGILDFTISSPLVNFDRHGRWPVIESVRRFLVKPIEHFRAGQATRNDVWEATQFVVCPRGKAKTCEFVVA